MIEATFTVWRDYRLRCPECRTPGPWIHATFAGPVTDAGWCESHRGIAFSRYYSKDADQIVHSEECFGGRLCRTCKRIDWCPERFNDVTITHKALTDDLIRSAVEREPRFAGYSFRIIEDRDSWFAEPPPKPLLRRLMDRIAPSTR